MYNEVYIPLSYPQQTTFIHFLNVVFLPWHLASRWHNVISQEIALLLGNESGIPCPSSLHTLHGPQYISPPCSFIDPVVGILPVCQGWWHVGLWSALMQEVVEACWSQGDLGDPAWVKEDCGAEHPKPIGKNAKGIFYDSPCPWEAVVVDFLIVVQLPEGLGLHQVGSQRVRFIPHKHIG